MTRDDVEKALWRWTEWKADQRLVDEMLAVIDQYAAAREKSPEALEPAAGTLVPLTGYQDAEGMLWVRVGDTVAVPSPAEERIRTCSQCGTRKPITRYRRDVKSRRGRKAKCMDCENVQRRQWRAEKKQVAPETP